MSSAPSHEDAPRPSATVGDLLRREVVSVAPSTSVRQLVEVLRRHRISGAPVVDDGGALVGTVSVSDLTWLCDWLAGEDSGDGRRASAAKALDQKTVGEIMTPDVFGVEPSASLAELARFFARTGLRRAVVLDDGRLAGIVSVTDLLGLIADQA